jgi:uncharacterized phage infection (PIP) family protein YhgE
MKQNSKLIETDESVNILTPAIIPNGKHPGGRPNKDLTELKNEGAALFEAQKKELTTYLYYTDAVNDGASLIANTLKTLNKNRKKTLLSMLDIKNLSLGLGIMQDKASLYKSKAIGKMTDKHNKDLNTTLQEIKAGLTSGNVNVTLEQTKQSVNIKGINE